MLLSEPRSLRSRAIWIADRIHAFIAIIAVARGAAALVASDAISPAAIASARADGIPVVSDVPGLFGWARPGRSPRRRRRHRHRPRAPARDRRRGPGAAR